MYQSKSEIYKTYFYIVFRMALEGDALARMISLKQNKLWTGKYIKKFNNWEAPLQEICST